MDDSNSILQISTSVERKVELRILLEQLRTLRKDEKFSSETSQIVNDIIKRTNELYDTNDIHNRINQTDEVLLDAKIVATASDIIYNFTDSINCLIDNYDPKDYATKLVQSFSTNDDEHCSMLIEATWLQLNKVTKPKFKRINYFQEKEITPVEPKIIAKKVKQVQAPKAVPEKITETTKEEESVDETVEFINWSLRHEYEENKESICYFKFLFDPTSFDHTVQNIFHFSFLVRDSKAKMIQDDNNQIFILPVRRKERKDVIEGRIAYTQFILGINMEEWEKIIQTFNIKDCILNKWKKKFEEKNNQK